jgi:hypothetical protein
MLAQSSIRVHDLGKHRRRQQMPTSSRQPEVLMRDAIANSSSDA